MTKKIAFLDRDDILIVDTGYPHKPDELQFKEEILPLLSYLKGEGFEFIVVTNQSGIGRGYYGIEDYEACMKVINDYYQSKGISLLAWYYSPYHIDGVGEYKKESECRKPRPGMIHQACSDFDIDIKNSLMIGDKDSDRIQLNDLKSYIVTEKEHGDFKSFDQLLFHLKNM